MKSPRIWRKKRPGGKLYGSYLTTVDGVDVNLRTSDANEATTRAKDAHQRGRRNFVDEIDEAAAAVDGPAAAPAAPPAAPPAAAQRAPDPPVSSDFQATSSKPPNPTPAPLQLGAAAAAGSSSDTSARAEAEATNAAAAADAGDDQAANDNGQSPLPDIPPEVLKHMLTQAALVIVDVQLRIQAYAVGRALNRIPGEIAADSPARKLAADAWAAQLQIWIPADKMLPPWALALALPLMCIPVQIATSQPIPDEKEGPEDAADESKAAA